MTPFAVQQVWRAGRPVPVSEKGSTLALLLEATVQRITAAATSAIGCACCRCSIRIRRTADLQSVTVAVARSDDDQFRTLSRVYPDFRYSRLGNVQATDFPWLVRRRSAPQRGLS